MIPVISFVGRKNSGKTTYISALIPALEAAGIRVAVVKQHKHDVPVDIEGKDSWRYAQAGASCSIMSTSRQLSLVFQRSPQPDETRMASLAELAAVAQRNGCEILLAESFNASVDADREALGQAFGLYVVARAERTEEPRFGPADSEAIITDDPELAQSWQEAGKFCFDLNNPADLATQLAKNPRL